MAGANETEGTQHRAAAGLRVGARPWPRMLRQLLAPTLIVLLVTALVLGALTLGASWLLRSEGGSAWLLSRLPGVTVTGLRGAVLSEHFEADRVHIDVGARLKSITIEALVADGVRWRWLPQGQDSLTWIGLDAKRLSARQVDVQLGTSKSARIPNSVGLPVVIHADLAQVDELLITALPPMRNVRAQVTIGAAKGNAHRIEDGSFDSEQVHVTASADLGTTRPFAFKARALATPIATPMAAASAASAAAPPWSASITSNGSLERFETRATLRGRATPQHAAPALDLTATVMAFAPWPLAALSASTTALDLSAFSARAPQTRLSGQVEVQTRALDAPISATVHLDNQIPGRWDAQRLPLRRIELNLRAALNQRDRVDISSFDLVLGQGQADGGRLRGSGQWRGHDLLLETQLQDLRPQLLDARASRIALTGPLKLAVHGLPSPDPRVLATTAASAAGAASAATSNTAAVPPWSVDLLGTLDGHIDAAAQTVRTVQLQLDASVNATRLDLRQLRATAGAATARVQAVAERSASGQWSVQSVGSLNDFDPLTWWPGSEGSAWRQGPHRFFADWRLDLRLPPLTPPLTSLSRASAAHVEPRNELVHWAQTTVGSGTLNVHDSQLAGVPLQLNLALAQTPGNTSLPSSLKGELQIGGNRVVIDGQGNPLGNGSADRMHVDVQAPNLASLAPIARLLPELAPWAPRQGSLQAAINGEGRWPDARTNGEVKAQQLQAGELALASAQGSWRFDTAADQPLSLQFEVTRMKLGAQAIEQANVDLQGTLAQHQLTMNAALPLRPPAWAESWLGLRTQSGTRAQLQADGAWVVDTIAGGGTWRGSLHQLAVGPWDAAKPAAQAALPPWFEGRELRTQLRFTAHGSLLEMRADPGSVQLADGVSLQWDEVRLDNRSAQPDFQLRATISPFMAAPVLARMQPTMGWGGDLRLAATLDIKAAQGFDADVVFERRSGDLFAEDAGGRQAMGLTQMRLALGAHDGQWSFTQRLAGSSLGEVSGTQQLRMPAGRRWPDAQTALEGSVQAKVANLGIWGTWVPPGWRLVGALDASASIGGRVGAPEYTGQMRGTGIGVRNLLLGVDVSGGDVAIALKGTTAQLEKFSFRAGEGTLTVSGNADLGSTPKAHLELLAEHFRVLGRVDRQLIVSGKGTLELQADRVALDSAIRVDEGLFDLSRSDAPALDDDVSIRSNAPKPTGDATDTARGPRRDARVLIAVDLGDKLRVRGRGLDTALAGQLRITTPGGRLAVQGVVQAVGGNYAAYGQKLDIERGILSFSGPPANPALDILALRPNIDARVGVAISGSFVNPRVRLFADPEMSDTDKLSWLVLGRPSDGLGRADTALLQRAAVALLAGEGEAPTDAFLRSIGIDELSLRQSDGDVRETVISLGKQLSRRWYVGYERGVNATSGSFQLIYRIAQRFTLRAQSGHDNSLDVIWVWRVGETPALPWTKTTAPVRP